MEAFPTKGETATVVAKKISEEIVPRHGLPVTVGSDNGPAFVSQIVHGRAQALGTKWKLHYEYNPQSSGQVERMNRTLKETLTKLAIETGGDWETLLPFALFRVHNTPDKTQQQLNCARGWGLVNLFTYWANHMFKCEGF